MSGMKLTKTAIKAVVGALVATQIEKQVDMKMDKAAAWWANRKANPTS